MNNQTIIEQLEKLELLSVCELLVSCLKSDDNLWEIADWELFSELPTDVINYCDSLTAYERLKFLAQIANTLVSEEEEAAAAIGKQLQLPVR